MAVPTRPMPPISSGSIDPQIVRLHSSSPFNAFFYFWDSTTENGDIFAQTINFHQVYYFQPALSTATVVPPGAGASAQMSGRTPTLVIPSDPNRWREMQRSLVMGGVYHVQANQANAATQYCLWNGTQLVPCKLYTLSVL